MAKTNWRAAAAGISLIIGIIVVYTVAALTGLLPGAITPLSIALVIFSGAIIIFASILPISYGKKKAFINIAYAAFFFAIISIEVALLKPYFERVGEINVIECKSENFQASEGRDLVRIVLCMFTGYELKEYSAFSAVSFIIFYILLPAVFLSVFIYGLMSGLDIGFMFGKSSDKILKILSFIIGLYGVRVMFGPFLLTFFAAGFWGLAGLFGAIILTQSLRKIVNNAFIVEKRIDEEKGIVEYQKKVWEGFKNTLRTYFDDIEGYIKNNSHPSLIEPYYTRLMERLSQYSSSFTDPRFQNLVQIMKNLIEAAKAEYNQEGKYGERTRTWLEELKKFVNILG